MGRRWFWGDVERSGRAEEDEYGDVVVVVAAAAAVGEEEECRGGTAASEFNMAVVSACLVFALRRATASCCLALLAQRGAVMAKVQFLAIMSARDPFEQSSRTTYVLDWKANAR